MNLYELKAKYHETDQMGVIHHSNYIKWMEDARIYIMNELGFPYKKFEEMGIISPVLSLECDYKKSVEFGDEVRVKVFLKEMSTLKFVLGYEMYNMSKSGELCTIASTTHCFLKRGGRPMNLKKEMPEFFDSMENMVFHE